MSHWYLMRRPRGEGGAPFALGKVKTWTGKEKWTDNSLTNIVVIADFSARNIANGIAEVLTAAG